jgi:hypothetical protein
MHIHVQHVTCACTCACACACACSQGQQDTLCTTGMPTKSLVTKSRKACLFLVQMCLPLGVEPTPVNPVAIVCLTPYRRLTRNCSATTSENLLCKGILDWFGAKIRYEGQQRAAATRVTTAAVADRRNGRGAGRSSTREGKPGAGTQTSCGAKTAVQQASLLLVPLVPLVRPPPPSSHLCPFAPSPP